MAKSGVQWFRGPRRWVPLLATLVFVLLTFALQNRSQPLWVLGAVVATLSYVVKVLPDAWREKQNKSDERRQLTRAVTTSSTEGGARVRLVREMDDHFLRRRPARWEIPYQRRDAEQEAMKVLDRRLPLLLVGPSMAGKSTLAEHLIRDRFPQRALWIPLPAQLPKLLEAGDMTGSVVALDDLERFLNVAELRTDWVQLLTGRDNVIVATMRASCSCS